MGWVADCRARLPCLNGLKQAIAIWQHMAVQKKELLAPDILALKVFLAMKKISKVPPLLFA